MRRKLITEPDAAAPRQHHGSIWQHHVHTVTLLLIGCLSLASPTRRRQDEPAGQKDGLFKFSTPLIFRIENSACSLPTAHHARSPAAHSERSVCVSLKHMIRESKESALLSAVSPVAKYLFLLSRMSPLSADNTVEGYPESLSLCVRVSVLLVWIFDICMVVFSRPSAKRTHV